jgi:hypothetical protein
MDLHNPIDWNVRCREVMAERDQALELLRRVDHTLTAHGQLHASTPLHDAIQLLLPEGWA